MFAAAAAVVWLPFDVHVLARELLPGLVGCCLVLCLQHLQSRDVLSRVQRRLPEDMVLIRACRCRSNVSSAVNSALVEHNAEQCTQSAILPKTVQSDVAQ